MKFRTTILQAGKTATGIQVPAKIVERLGAGKRPPVRVTINGYTYRSTVAVMGGAFILGSAPSSARMRVLPAATKWSSKSNSIQPLARLQCLKGDGLTKDVIDTWLDDKRKEVATVCLRPHPTSLLCITIFDQEAKLLKSV
jgi:Domain of unknown function (DUF1905)